MWLPCLRPWCSCPLKSGLWRGRANHSSLKGLTDRSLTGADPCSVTAGATGAGGLQLQVLVLMWQPFTHMGSSSLEHSERGAAGTD